MVLFSELPLNDELADKLGELKIDFAFQPIFAKKTMTRVGYEALMRPLGSTPLAFIKEYRMKGGLHTLEIATFLGATKAYYDRGLTGRISINSFPAECFSKSESSVFFRCFPDIAEEMYVEILEYTVLDFEKWLIKRDQIRSNNIRISLDDFGTGNNDMLAVNKFRPDEIKIDRSIITDIHKSPEKQKRFVQLINIFHEQRIKVLAEGVECKEELDYILTTDVDYLQGFYLGRPE